MESIGGGAAGSVWRVWLADGSTVVVKASGRAGRLDAEARSLKLLAERSRLPVPRVLHADPTLLVLQDMPGSPGACPEAELHAAELLAALHAERENGRYGLGFDNTCGPLPQENTWCGSWPEFYRDRRLLAMTRAGVREGTIPAALAERVERIASRLDELLPAAPAPSLIHGDVWSGNVLCREGRVTAFLDPSPYFAHAEVELAFITLFSTFGERFFGRYFDLTGTAAEHRREFFRARREVYILYPLLVHVRLFGGGYADQLSRTLRGLGF
jgi:fructosamine-3-kinase